MGCDTICPLINPQAIITLVLHLKVSEVGIFHELCELL